MSLIKFTPCSARSVVAQIVGFAVLAGVAGLNVSNAGAAQCASIPAKEDLSVTRAVYNEGKRLGVSDRVMLAAFEGQAGSSPT